jgi:hypothetical protein
MYDEEVETQEDSEQKMQGHLHQQRWALKTRRRSSDMKSFMSDRLELGENPKMVAMMSKYGEHIVMFSDMIMKINRKGRMKEYWMMITDGGMYLLEVGSAKLHHRIPLADISHISASLLPDNFFVIHVPADQDRLFISGRKTEIVTSLRIVYFDHVKQELNIALQNIIVYRIDKDRVRKLVFIQGRDGVYTRMFSKKSK